MPKEAWQEELEAQIEAHKNDPNVEIMVWDQDGEFPLEVYDVRFDGHENKIVIEV